MSTQSNKALSSSYNTETATLNEAIIEGIRDKKGKKIVQLDMRHIIDAPAQYFIVCEGDSNVHVKAISDGIRRRLRVDLATRATHIEGSLNARWVLMDYFDVVVHIFHPETREFYDIERLWGDAKVTEFEEI